MVVVKGDINSIQRCVDNYVKVVSKKRIVDSDEEVSFSDPSFSLGLCSSISEDEKNCLEDEIVTVEEENCDLELEDDEFIDYSNGASSEEEDDEFVDYSNGVSSDDVDDFINYEGFVTEEEVVEDYSSEEEGFSWGSYEEGEEVEWENPLVVDEEEVALWENPLVDEDEEEEVYDEVGWDYPLVSTETEEEHDEEVLWENPLVDEEEVLWGSPIIAEEVHESSSLDKEEVKEEEINEVEEIQVPKDLRDFVKIYNNCEMSFALEYFSKKEIDKQLSLGRVFKRKNRLLI